MVQKALAIWVVGMALALVHSGSCYCFKTESRVLHRRICCLGCFK